MKKIICTMLAFMLVMSVSVFAAPVDMQVDVTNSVTKLIGLKTDGTVDAHGYSLINGTALQTLTGAKQVACEDFVENSFFALMEDGTVKEFSRFTKKEFADVADWTDIVAIDGGNGFLAGLKADGTVVIAGANKDNFKKALKWQNVASIYAKEDCITAITTEGKALAAGLIGTLDSKIASWTNMKKVVYDKMSFWGITNEGEIITTNARFDPSKIPGSEVISEIEDIEVVFVHEFYSRVFILRKDGTLYEVENYSTKSGGYKPKKLYDDVHSIAAGGIYFAAVLKDGEIVSDKLNLSSMDWILGIDIRVGGKYVDCDVQPYIKNDRTMVPIRAISEALGAEVGYDDATKTAVITKDGKTVKVTMNSADAFVDDALVSLDAPAENVNGRIFVPVRFVSEGLGCQVNWIAETKSVMINQ